MTSMHKQQQLAYNRDNTVKKQTKETREQTNQIKSNRHLVIDDCLCKLLQQSGNIKL